MKVHQLRIILDHVPGDLDVVVRGRRTGRVTDVQRLNRTRRHAAGSLVLADYPPPWGQQALPDDDFRLSGNYRRRAGLLRRLDPDEPAGEPA